MSAHGSQLTAHSSRLTKQKHTTMKFIHYIEKISGVDIYGLISLGIFFLFFVVMLTWVLRSDKKKLKKISEIPLNN